MLRNILLAGFLFLFLAGCLAPLRQEALRPAEGVRLRKLEVPPPLADDKDRLSLQAALEKSLTHLEKKPARNSATYAGFRDPFFTPERTHRSAALFRKILLTATNEAEFLRAVRENFTFWEATLDGQTRPILLTGYYEPSLEGSLAKGPEYRYPLYRRPGDLFELKDRSPEKRVVRMEKGRPLPYYSRREIDTQGALAGKGWELIWLKDPWERFVLHVQGSGQVRLPDGQSIRVGFAASNGLPYRSIGRVLIERGEVPEKELTMQRIQDFLRQNPGRMEEILNANERYVFFRLLTGSEGPVGALGLPLTAGRSIATDLTLFPPGAVAYVTGKQPVFDARGRVQSKKPFARFVLNQDTGAAIKGIGRVDFFCGSGDEAGMTAGAMRDEGRIYFLLAK